MHVRPALLLAVAALGFVGALAVGVRAGALEAVDSPRARPAPVASIQLLSSIPLPGPPTGLAVGRTRVAVAVALAGVVLVRKTDSSVADRLSFDGAATTVAAGDNRFWVTDLFHDRVLELDEAGVVQRRIPVGGLPGGIALTRTDVWVLGLETPSITVSDRDGELPPLHLTFGAGELWPGAIAAGPHGVWVSTGHRTGVTLIDDDTPPLVRGRVALWGVERLVSTATGAWAARRGSGAELVRIDGTTLGLHPVDLPGRMAVTAMGAEDARLVVAVDGALLSLDATTGATRARTAVSSERELAQVAVDGRTVWAIDAAHHELLRFRIQRSSERGGT